MSEEKVNLAEKLKDAELEMQRLMGDLNCLSTHCEQMIHAANELHDQWMNWLEYDEDGQVTFQLVEKIGRVLGAAEIKTGGND